MLAVGTEDEVMRQVVLISSDCEGGMLKPGGRDSTPEAFIEKMRRLLGRSGVQGNRGWWRPEVCLVDEAAMKRAMELGASVTEEVRWGSKFFKARFDDDALPGYFTFVTEHHRSMYGHRMADVGGLPRS